MQQEAEGVGKGEERDGGIEGEGKEEGKVREV